MVLQKDIIESQRAQIRQFLSRQKLITVMNILLILWTIVQVSLYSWQLTLIPCQQVRILIIGYIVSYILYLLMPILSIVSCHCYNVCMIAIVYALMNIVIKIIDIVIVSTVAWRHVGLCYINYEMKIIIICLCISEIFILFVQAVIMYRRRNVYQIQKKLKDLTYDTSVNDGRSGKQMFND